MKLNALQDLDKILCFTQAAVQVEKGEAAAKALKYRASKAGPGCRALLAPL